MSCKIHCLATYLQTTRALHGKSEELVSANASLWRKRRRVYRGRGRALGSGKLGSQRFCIFVARGLWTRRQDFFLEEELSSRSNKEGTASILGTGGSGTLCSWKWRDFVRSKRLEEAEEEAIDTADDLDGVLGPVCGDKGDGTLDWCGLFCRKVGNCW